MNDINASSHATQQVFSPSADVIPFERAPVPAREEYVEAIHIWCKTRDTAEVLSREEIGQMRAFDRVDAQRKAMIIGMAHYLRKRPRSDVAMGVYLVLTLMSDNDRGCASVSQPTLARLFDRSVSSIADAQKRLKDDGLIIMGRGRYAGTYPVIPRIVTQQYNHLAWLLGALSDADKPINLPAGPVDCQSSGQTGGLASINLPDPMIENFNQPVEGSSINRPDAIQLHSSNSVIVGRAAKITAAVLATSVPALPAAADHIEPPAIVRPASTIGGKELIDRLQDAGGRALNLTKPIFHIAEVPRNWMAAGCDLELDILPTIRAMTANKAPNSIHVWKYFESSILGSRDARMAPLSEAKAPPRSKYQSEEDNDRRERFLAAAMRS